MLLVNFRLGSGGFGVKKLTFRLDDEIREGVKHAKRRYKQRHDSLDFNIVKVPGFGRTDLKKAGLGPDSMMQLAIQMAHHKIHPSGSPCSVYESCSTAIFK